MVQYLPRAFRASPASPWIPLWNANPGSVPFWRGVDVDPARCNTEDYYLPGVDRRTVGHVQIGSIGLGKV